MTVNTGNTKSMFIIPYHADNNKEEWEEKGMITALLKDCLHKSTEIGSLSCDEWEF
ncbi:MAG: hypothetical protein ACRD5B_04990 [Nitrososphaeraceae archaeon]